MAELKLRRLTELNARLREDLDRPRIKVSDACQSMTNYTRTTKDFMVPSTWGSVDKRDDPYAPQQSGGCCVIS
jgi:guanine nucleotide-binding protein subunit gamma